MNKNKKTKIEKIKHVDENRSEFWYIKELMIALRYSSWNKFKHNVIKKANIACENSNLAIDKQFPLIGKSLNLPNVATKIRKRKHN